jgi:outer membrane protein TolC
LLIQSSVLQQPVKTAELKSLEEVVQAKSYQEKMAYSKYIPKIAVKGHYEFIDDDLSMLDPKWYIGIGAKWQIFDGLKSYDNARKRKLDKEIYQEKIKETKDLLNLAQTNAKLNYELSLKQIKRYQEAVDLAKDTYDLVNKQYQNGLVSITELLDALTRWQKADFNLQKAYFNQRQAAVEVFYRKDLLTE